MFAVVEFVEDKSVDIVPLVWLNGDKICYWPPFRASRLTAAVKKCEMPNHELWSQCTVRVLGRYDSYNIAREKLRRAEDTSTLETDHEEPSVRQRRKKHFTDTEDECDDSPCPASVSKKKPPKKISKTSLPLPVPPVSLHQSALVSRCDVSDDQQMASPRRSIRWSPTKLSGSISSQVPASPRTCGSSVRSSPTELSRSISSPILVSPRRSVRTSPAKLSSSISSQVPASPRTCGSSVRSSPTELSQSISSPILVSPRRSVRTSPAKLSSSIGSSSQVPASSKTCGSIALRSPTELSRNPSPPVTANTGIHPDMARRVGTTAGLLRGTTGGDAISQNEARSQSSLGTVLLKLTRIEQQQRFQTDLLQQVLSTMPSLLDDDFLELPDGIVLPVQSMAELLDLESKLQDDNNFRKLIRYLGAIGGKDIAETTRRVLRSLMANSVAQQMNFVGRGQKRGIQQMRLLQVVIGATRRNKLLKKATRSQIENVVKQWLRYSCDRDGGRRALNRCVNGKRTLSGYESILSDSDAEL